MLHNGDRIAGTLRAKARSAHQGWYKWGNCEKVKEASVHVVSILMCLKIQEAPSLHHNSVAVGKLLTGASSLTLSPRVSLMLKVLYLDVRPLGLQALHTGQNLLLVASQGHSHLSQFTRWKTQKKYRQSITKIFCYEENASVLYLKYQVSCPIHCLHIQTTPK